MRIERHLKALERSVFKMTQMTEKMFNDLAIAIEREDLDLARKIIEQDEIVNQCEQTIHQQALMILSLMQPVAKDLRYVISSIKIANDLERIADYAKNIASYIQGDFLTILNQTDFLEMLEVMMLSYQGMQKLLEKPDARKAHRLALQDQNIDKAFNLFFYSLEGITADLDSVLELATLGRQIERAGDHIKNICEEVIYMKTGELHDFG